MDEAEDDYKQARFRRLYSKWAREQGFIEPLVQQMLKEKMVAPEEALTPEALDRLKERAATSAPPAVPLLEQPPPAKPVAFQDSPDAPRMAHSGAIENTDQRTDLAICPWGCGAMVKHLTRHGKRCPK